jgi:uncharacterized protein (DUF433 family)
MPSLDIYAGQDPREIPAYTLGDVARLSGVPYATARSWIEGRSYPTRSGEGYFAPLIERPQGSSLLSFVNLIEIHVLASLRRRHRVALPAIRHALNFLKQRSSSRHPLAEQTFETDGIDIFVRSLGEVSGEQSPINLSQGGQMAIREMIEAHLQRVERDQVGSPIRLFPFVRHTIGENAKEMVVQPRPIVVDPSVSFGKPVLAGTGLPVEMVIDRYRAGDKISDLALDLEIATDQIEDALHFYLNRMPLAA